ncbi:hypothetical protein [Hymenobacter volaticus]|uniref:Uncharacterized protein n=1 Tax=Hymenobacter volaticus TaxID=2932254 RepID=A0ABY4G851_9BACT|nr:hypothetical protein [Hymenobacter volaticus]UOQ67063.1 hypothetical protein MUN86_03910 [Hymenobacter volaticus]
MSKELLMQVEKSVNLTGLGVLLIAQHATPLLKGFDLHMRYLVQLVFPDGAEIQAIASIEAISRPVGEPEGAATEAPALLLAEEGTDAVPSGTLVYLLQQTE